MNIFDEITENVKNFINTFLTIDLWRIILCILIVLLGLLMKNLISKILFRIIEKKMRGKGKSEAIVDNIIKIIDRPSQLAVVTLTIALCNMILRLPAAFSSVISKTITSLILFVAFWMLYNSSTYVKLALDRITTKSETHLDDIAANYLVYAVRTLIIILGGLSILQIWVGDITSLIAGLSIGGVAFALAAQDTAANLIGSITVMLDHPFELGEYIDIGGCAGTVEKMGLHSTRIRTLDQSVIIIPNKTLSSSNITNWSKIEHRRVTFTIGVTYSTTSAQLRELVGRIQTMLEARDDISHDGLMVKFADFGASSLDINIRFYTLTGGIADAVEMREKINFEIMDIVAAMGLSFAFPSQSVYVEALPASYQAKQ